MYFFFLFILYLHMNYKLTGVFFLFRLWWYILWELEQIHSNLALSLSFSPSHSNFSFFSVSLQVKDMQIRCRDHYFQIGLVSHLLHFYFRFDLLNFKFIGFRLYHLIHFSVEFIFERCHFFLSVLSIFQSHFGLILKVSICFQLGTSNVHFDFMLFQKLCVVKPQTKQKMFSFIFGVWKKKLVKNNTCNPICTNQSFCWSYTWY